MPLHVLIVDDSPMTREITAEQVRALGHRADLAADGAAALELIARAHYDVVLMDVNMPVMDGPEVARRVRARYDGRGPTRIVGLSAGDAADRERSLAAGMDAFLRRPASLDQLRAALDGASPPPPPLGQAPAALDLTVVQELAAAIGLGELRQVAGAFVAETPQLLAALADAAGPDPAAAYRLSHLIKGRALSLGAVALADLAGAVEARAAAGAPISQAALAALAAALADASAALGAYLSRPPGGRPSGA